ncbi:MAG: hypothetical protein H7833_02005 [Magnetococcus sp. DMHC-1]|nr:hypothetical protein [Magnetococcales bacterium]
MKFGPDPNMTEETRQWIESTRPIIDRILQNQETNPAGYFKGEKTLGGKFYPPGVKPPPTLWEQMKASGEIEY